MKMKTESNNLKAEAESIIRDLNLFEMLQSQGEARVVGSVALNLVVKPDIDIHLLTRTDDLMSVVDNIYHLLLNQPGVNHVKISDYRERGGLKVGLDSYPGCLADWSLDLWVTNDRDTTGFALVDRLNRELTKEHLVANLEIKKALHAEGGLQDGMSSRIYTAVVDHGIRSAAEFENHVVE